MMLFLGAGASKRFGIKTMDEMSEEFESKAYRLLNLTRPNDEKELYHKIRDAISTNNLEEILTVLNDLSEKAQSPTVRFLKSQLRHDMSNRDITEFILEVIVDMISPNLPKELQSTIIRFIKENCVLEERKEILQNIIRVYDQLFEILKIKSSSIDIFTTNYDLVIEKYYDLLTDAYHLFGKKYNYVEKRDISYTDGFLFRVCIGIIVGTTTENVWGPKKYDEIIEHVREKTQNAPLIRLFKLHGSIDQYYQNGEIVKKDTLFSTKTVGGIEPIDSMIYPMREKKVYKDPFFELFTRLKTSLLSENICIVIGYSFGDGHIRNIFFDAVKRNPKIKILLWNKNLEEVMKKLEPIRDNAVIPIEGEFGEETFFERLEEELEKIRRGKEKGGIREALLD